MKTHPLDTFDSLGRLNVVIDAPRGGACRYRFTERSGRFEVCGLQPRARGIGVSQERETAWQTPPFDLGFIPGAYDEDGRRLDVLLLDDAPASVGGIVPSRLIGLIAPIDPEAQESASLLVAASVQSSRFSCIGSLLEVHAAVWSAIGRFYREGDSRRGEGFAHGPVAARRFFLKGLERGDSRRALPERSVPQPLKVRVTPGAFLEGRVHLKRDTNTLARRA